MTARRCGLPKSSAIASSRRSSPSYGAAMSMDQCSSCQEPEAAASTPWVPRSFPERGTVFRAMANEGAWGFFDARDGALVSADGQTISLPAPVVVDATTLKGDGWTATVSPGWTVQPGPRPGSFRVVKQ